MTKKNCAKPDKLYKAEIMEIKPFKAFRFNPDIVGNVENCIAPPYDVINPSQQEQLYKKSPHNIARIIKGKQEPSDNDQNNSYTRAAAYLQSWISEGAIKQDTQETIYAYIQDFEVAEVKYQRYSFIALAKLEDFGPKVRPHEEVFEKPMLDRLSLKRATKARFGLVFMLYEDTKQTAEKIIQKLLEQKPLIDSNEDNGGTGQENNCSNTSVRHRLYPITNKDDISVITQMMSDKNCIIADGHHRYTTGLTYAKENDNPSSKYQMMAFTNTCQEGLVVLATHRLVENLDDFSINKLIEDLKSDFTITEHRFVSPDSKADALQKMLGLMATEHRSDKNALGIYGANNAFYVAVLKNIKLMDKTETTMSQAWKSLDVSILHKLVLDRGLGINPEKLATGIYVQYVKDTPNAIKDSIEQVDAGKKQVAFFLNPVKMQQLREVTNHGERMPQKSTYFYPKMYTGLTIQKL